MIEGITFGLILFVLPLAVIVGIASALVAAREADHDDPPTDEGIGSVRRLFIYVLAFAGLAFTAIGVSMIIGGAIDAVTGNALLLDRRQAFAVALAFTVVGTPAWLLFMLLAQRSIRAHEVERRSQARRLYFGVARSVALAVVTWNAITAIQMLLRVADVEGGTWGTLVAWAGVWAIHQRLASAEPAPTVMTRLIDRLALYFGALLGLLLLLEGTMGVLAAPLSAAYDRTFSVSILGGTWDRGLREAIAPLLVGGALWVGYWLRAPLRRDRLTTLWRVHVFLFGELIGVTLTIVPAAAMLYTLAEWFAGTPSADNAAAQFADVPTRLATMLVGIAAWGYHRAVIAEAGDAHERSGPERVYRYVLAAAGLVTTAVGVATLIALAAEALSTGGSGVVLSDGWWRNPLLNGTTELVVGAPIWAWAWFDTQRALATGVEERVAPSRRVYVFATVGVAVFALLVSLTIVLYQLFEAMLANDLSLALLRDINWALATALTTGAIAYYHVLVLREDQAVLPEADATPVRTRNVVLVAVGDAHALVADLERIDGVRVRTWRRLDGDAVALTDTQRTALRDAIASTDADRVLAIVRGDTFEVVPYVEDAR